MPETATGATRYDEIVMIFSPDRGPDGALPRPSAAAAIYPVRAESAPATDPATRSTGRAGHDPALRDGGGRAASVRANHL
jgi:hypothetical protein